MSIAALLQRDDVESVAASRSHMFPSMSYSDKMQYTI
jgi:hypothetical protein